MNEIFCSVGLGEIIVTGDKRKILVAHGLGSCVGVVAYDPKTSVGGMVHVMLPEVNGTGKHEAKYANIGVPMLFELLKKKGAEEKRLVIKIAGGASMFSVSQNGGIFSIGPRNIDMVKKMINSQGLKILSEDTGMNYGRTLTLRIEDGKVKVKSMLYGEKEL